jgi:uncharacterized protein YcfJ
MARTSAQRNCGALYRARLWLSLIIQGTKRDSAALFDQIPSSYAGNNLMTMKPLIAAFATLSLVATTPVFADPPAHAPAHGYHKKRAAQALRADTRVWRGDDGKYYCTRDDGTTGLIIGAAVGGLAGNEVAGRGDKLLGTLLGAAGGALLGRAIDRDRYRCQ